MKIAQIKFIDVFSFFVIVAAFSIYGQSVGWRVLGAFMLLFSFNTLRTKKVSVGWEGFEPKSIFTGASAVVIGLLAAAISIVLLAFPEQTVMVWGDPNQ